MAKADRTHPSNPEAGLSILAADVVIDGDVSTAGGLHLDGRIVGRADVRELTIGEGGSVHGDIHADTLTVRGSVTGNLSARMIRLERSARVTGDVAYTSIGMEAGAQVHGRFVHIVESNEVPVPQLLVVGGD